MEGGPSIFAEPNEIADRYKKALSGYLADLQAGLLEASRRLPPCVTIDENYPEQVLDLLLGRRGAHSKGCEMSFLQP